MSAFQAIPAIRILSRVHRVLFLLAVIFAVGCSDSNSSKSGTADFSHGAGAGGGGDDAGPESGAGIEGGDESQAISATCEKKDLPTESNSRSNDFQAKVIYGDDDRREFCEVSDPTKLALSDSTAILVKNEDLVDKGSVFKFNAVSFGQQFDLCKEEPYRDQPALGFCSGFLVGEDTLVTAGHCIRSEVSCQNTSFLFGFKVEKAGRAPSEVKKSEVYTCASLVRSVVDSNGTDYAIVKLNRKVVGHNPLKMREAGAASVGDPLVVMGYPSGIPLKIAGGARVRSTRGNFFVANLDTYGGNSGSAVFNATTGLVEGILVRGEADFVSRGGCRVSNRCADDQCRGEDVTSIAEVLKAL